MTTVPGVRFVPNAITVLSFSTGLTSIVFATLYGVLLLREQIGRTRLVGCGLIAVGVLAIALGG